ncbi:MAG: GPR endopeptidase [Clostridia bacterium]|nr:GPR endopeptidase [Clostridia bacterium]
MPIRTDLALEAREMRSGTLEGVESESFREGDVLITRVKIVNQKGAEALGKSMGTYVTLEAERMRENDKEIYDNICTALARELRAIANLPPDASVLAAGLGNRFITPDSIGPIAVSHLLITRHLKTLMPQELGDDVRTVSAVAPGVLGLTGIETGEIIRGVVEKTAPSAVFVIDALASRKMERVGTTIQLTDTGIRPGSGVGNNRRELSRESLGVPVVAIGVPMVVDAATVASDAIDIVLECIKKEDENHVFGEMFASLSDLDRYKLIFEALEPSAANMVVTPKEVDSLSNRVGKIIANGINLALQDSMTQDDIDRYLYVIQ